MKKILLGLVALSSVAMAAQDTTPTQTDSNGLKGTFSNRLGISYIANGSEDWDKDDSSRIDVFKESYELDYKLLYNVTDRFRWGGELGLDMSSFSDKFKKQIKKGSNTTTRALLIGVTGEYDVYQGRSAAIYLNGSIGAAAGKTKFDDEYGHEIGSLEANSYLKIGVGARFNNGLGLEVGRRSMQYRIEAEGESSDTLYRGQTYVQLNYTF